MNNELTIILPEEFSPITKQSGIEKAETYAATFAPFMITIKELSNKASAINKIDPSLLDAKLAREIRLAMAKNRTATAKQKDASKASLLAESNLIQNLHNVVVNISTLAEADMEAIEKYSENKEKERKAALQIERAAMFSEYKTDLTGYDLGNMADNVFSDLLESQKLLHEKRITEAARIEAEKIAAEKAELQRQAEIKAENERLKAEAEKKEKALVAERAEVARLAKIESDKQAAILKAEQDKSAKLKAETDANILADKNERERLLAELKKKEDAEKLEQQRFAKIESDRIAAEKKAAKAPVKEKLKIAITALSIDLPESEITVDILAKFNGFKTWSLQQIEQL